PLRADYKRDMAPRGWAIEVRLYAEDPTSFLPSSGTITGWKSPEGPGIRVDSGIAAGSEISVWYDPMLAKVIAWAGSRDAAIRRLRTALDELEVAGVQTNLPLLTWILADEVFQAGNINTDFLSQRPPPAFSSAGELSADGGDDAIVRAAATALRDGRSWRVGSVGIPLDLVVGGRTIRLRADLIDADRWRISGEVKGEISLDDLLPIAYSFAPPPATDVKVQASGTSSGVIVAPMPGKIVTIAVKEGEAVEERSLLLVLEAMKMEHRIEAPLAGTVKEIAVKHGALVGAGERLVTIA
ncbi:MAG: biotin/lipoyl-containing protein, partial [Polyangiaceae bacterium]